MLVRTACLCTLITIGACDSADEPAPTASGSGGGGQGAAGGGDGGGGADGGGGQAAGGDGGGGAPPECVDHEDCTDADEAQCDADGNCVPCEDSSHCAGVAGLPSCLAGSCVECQLGEEDACSGGETCDLLESECVAVAPGSVENCKACSNDLQCEAGHKCIPMDFDGQAHGHYCLKDTTGGCTEPYTVLINQPSISGEAAQNYCGIEEDLATCEAVHALLDNWRCSGTDGMCGPFQQPEVPVPGAICRDINSGTLTNRCTYACAGTPECPPNATQGTCDDNGGMGPPNWCGG